jgi:hypothetical protein
MNEKLSLSHLLWAVSCLGAIALAGGCGKTPPPAIVEAEGTISLDGKPLYKAEVRFIPATENGSEYIAKGVTDEKGRFKLTCKGQPGACACDNHVVVLETDIPPKLLNEKAQAELRSYLQSLGNRPLPKKYANVAESPLRITVTAEQKEYHFQLVRE